MKKTYVIPEVRTAQVGYEESFLASIIVIRNNAGEDLFLYDSDDPFDPWS